MSAPTASAADRLPGDPTGDPPSMPTGSPRSRRRAPYVALAVIAVVVIAGVLVARDVIESSFDRPSFPSLAEHPDPSLHGTVAYFDGQSRCVLMVAAAGSPSKQVLCLPPMDIDKAVALGAKETDPQLVWSADGQLEVTVFRAAMRKGEPPAYGAGYQKVVDVRSGAVRDTPTADVPGAPNLTTRPTTSPDGRRITTSSDPEFGRIEVRLTEGDRTRTLLSAHGPGKYTYGLDAAFWAPNWGWIAADDGRILIVTTGAHPTTRVLAEPTEGGGAGGDDARFASFAVTADDLLTAGD
jgi:hypothetical protein